ncbi:MAG: TetR/AcrR family transcriptional regulator, partial [Acidimicrobiia bacterium]
MTSAETSAPIGRPREFDHDSVLATVIDIFWEQGYSATSIGDVVERTGLSKSSLYGAFGSKEQLYRTALDRYLSDHRVMVTSSLRDGRRGVADIHAFLDQ